MEARVLERTRQPPPYGSTRRSTQTGTPAEHSSQSRRQNVAACWVAAAPLRTVHAIGRSGLRDTTATARSRLLTALDTQSGEVVAQTVPRHTSAAVVDVLGDIVATQPQRCTIHVTADNLSTHETQAVRTFLLAHPNVHLAVHADVFVVAHSSRTLVHENRPSALRARHLHLDRRSRRKIRRYIRHYKRDGESDSQELAIGASNW